MVGDTLGHADGSDPIYNCDIPVPRWFIVLATRAYSSGERAQAKAIHEPGSLGGSDRRLRVARVGLHTRRDLDLGAGCAVGVEFVVPPLGGLGCVNARHRLNAELQTFACRHFGDLVRNCLVLFQSVQALCLSQPPPANDTGSGPKNCR